MQVSGAPLLFTMKLADRILQWAGAFFPLRVVFFSFFNVSVQHHSSFSASAPTVPTDSLCTFLYCPR
jgi:hypothetical protein